MSKHGGYQIVDLYNIPIIYGKPGGTKIPLSTYEAVSEDIGKVKLLSGLVIGGGTDYDGEYREDTWVKFHETNGDYTGVVKRIVTDNPDDPTHYANIISCVLSINRDCTATILINSEKVVKKLPTVDQRLDPSSENAISGKAVAAALDDYLIRDGAKVVKGVTEFLDETKFYDGVSFTGDSDFTGSIMTIKEPVASNNPATRNYVDNIFKYTYEDEVDEGFTYNFATGILTFGGTLTYDSRPEFGYYRKTFDIGVLMESNVCKNILYKTPNIAGEVFALAENGGIRFVDGSTTECEIYVSDGVPSVYGEIEIPHTSFQIIKTYPKAVRTKKNSKKSN